MDYGKFSGFHLFSIWLISENIRIPSYFNSMSRCLHVSMSPCLHVSMSPYLHVFMSQFLHISMSHVYVFIFPCLHLHVPSLHVSMFQHSENGKQQLPFRKWEITNFSLFVFFAWQTINDNWRILFQQTCPSIDDRKMSWKCNNHLLFAQSL